MARAPNGLRGPPGTPTPLRSSLSWLRRSRWRAIISFGGYQSGHSCLSLIVATPDQAKPWRRADAVAHRAPALLDVVEVARPRIDDDRARRLAAQIGHAGAKVSRVDARQRHGGNREALPRDRAVKPGKARVEAAAAEPLDRGRRLRARHDRDLAAGGKARRRKARCGPGEDGTSTEIRHGSLQASSDRHRHEGRRGEALSFAKLARPINAGIAAGPRSHAAVRNQP